MPGILDRLREAAAYAEAKKLEAQRSIQRATGGGYAANQRAEAFEAGKAGVTQRINNTLANQTVDHPAGLPAKMVDAYYKLAGIKTEMPKPLMPTRDMGDVD